MRIALLAPFGLQPKGTVSARMMPLAEALARRGHLVRVVIPPWDDPSAQAGSIVNSVRTGADGVAGVHVVTLPLPRRGPYSAGLAAGLVRAALWPAADDGRWTINNGPQATGSQTPSSRVHRPSSAESHQALVSFGAEVVHVFKPVGFSGLAGLALWALRTPWVLDLDDWEGPGGWADVNPYSPAQKLAVTLQDALLPRMAGAVTAASRTLEARAWAFGLPRRRVLYMPNGVWRGKYRAWADAKSDKARRASVKARYGLGDGPIVLLYTRFAEFPWAWPLDVLSRVHDKQPEARLLVVGNGFFGEEGKLHAEAASRGLGDQVVVVGRVPEEELPAHLALGDVAIYPMADTLLNRAKSPVKVLEPMLMGIPVVAHRVGQAAEFIGDTGALLPPGDLRGMAEAVCALLAGPSRCESLGRRAQERVWKQFNWERLSGVAEAAYRSTLIKL
ncbi:MAG: glycosyltransferase family 4 protein [Chloroflexia bacterium]